MKKIIGFASKNVLIYAMDHVPELEGSAVSQICLYSQLGGEERTSTVAQMQQESQRPWPWSLEFAYSKN